LNNFGLRIPFVIISGVASVLFGLSLLRIIPGYGGVLLFAFHVGNYFYFIQTRYALLENIAILLITGIAWLYIAHKEFFIRNIHLICFFCGMLILVKQTFPIYCYLLVGVIAIVEKLALKRFIQLIAWSVFGLFIFGSVQLLCLYRVDLLDLYARNVIRAVYVHGGNSKKYSVLQMFSSPGLDHIFPYYFRLFSIWYFVPSHWRLFAIWDFIPVKSKFFSLWPYGFMVLIILVQCWLYKKKKISRTTLVLLLYLVLNLIFASQMLFYIKRAVVFFPITVLFLACLYRDAIESVIVDRKKDYIQAAVLVVIMLLGGTELLPTPDILKACPMAG